MRRSCLWTLLPILALGCEREPLEPTANFSVSRSMPSAPSDATTAAQSVSQIDISWRDNSSNETGFELHRSATGPSGAFSLLASAGANTTVYSDAGLSASAQYCYKVRAFRRYDSKISYSSFSNTACTSTLALPLPAAASVINAMPTGGGSIYLTWVDNSTNETGFRVERSATSDGPWMALASLEQRNLVEYYDQQPPVAEQPACYRVFAVNGSGDSPSSNVDCTAVPAPPSDLVATLIGSSVDLTWTDNSGIEDGFRVVRWGIVVATLPANTTTYHDPDLGDGGYVYYVLASKDGGGSVRSNDASVDLLTAPPHPVFANAYALTSGDLLVYWYDPAFNTASGFYVERSTDGGLSWTFVSEAASDEASIIDWEAPSEQQVCYRVFAFNAVGASDPSDIACTADPNPPTNLVATPANMSGAIDLTWTDNSNVEDGYVVVRAGYDVVARLGPNVTSYRESGLVPGASYTYYVRAKRGDGASAASNYASAIAP